MKFDFMISNPAFNIASTGNIAGTGGNTTLYRTATRSAFNRLRDGGMLMNVTLKGIIPDLIHGYFSKQQVHIVDMMSDIDVWPYNTCYFIISNTARSSAPVFKGGIVAKIFAENSADRFPFVYYSGSDTTMKGFSPDGRHEVIRNLPSRHVDGFVFDRTDLNVEHGWKFAFNVMESKKSYSVTNLPIRGGTICYIPTDTENGARRLKVFLERNEVYSLYVERMKIKYHAFGIRNVKRFDLSQIETGHEVPVEWGIDRDDLSPPDVLFNENVIDPVKLKTLGQVFTPAALVERMLDDLEAIDPSAFRPEATFCDTMCGNGRFLKAILQRKQSRGMTRNDALRTIYGVDLDPDVVTDCRYALAGDDLVAGMIVAKNIAVGDALSFDYDFL